MLTDILSRHFESAVRKRGDQYAAHGHVESVSIRRDTIKAVVAGSEAYDVWVDRLDEGAGWRLEAGCTCPYGGLCKHVWAVLVHAKARIRVAWGDPPELVRIDSTEGGSDPYGEDDGEDAGDLDGVEVVRVGTGNGHDVLRLGKNGPFLLLSPELERRLRGSNFLPAAGRKAPKEPKTPAWKRMLEETRPYTWEGHETGRSEAPISGNVWYILDEERTRLHSAIVVELARGEQHSADESAGAERIPRLAKLTINAGDIERIGSPEDRSICALLVGAARPGRETYAYSDPRRSTQRSAYWQLDPVMLRTAMPMLAATNRLLWRGAGLATTERAAWTPDAPWELAIELRPRDAEGGARAELCPVIRRVGGNGESLSLREGVVATEGEPGAVIHRGGVAPLRMAGGGGGSMLTWARSVAHRPPALVGREEVPALLDALRDKKIRLPLHWPDDWGPKRLTGVRPCPRLVLTTGARGGVDKLLHAEVQFRYEGTTAKADGGGFVMAKAADGTDSLVQRDAEAERLAVDRFLSLGGRRDAYNGLLRVPVNRVPEVAAGLLSEGWEVVRDAAAFRRAGTMRVSISSGTDWFDLEGAAEFDGASAPIGAVLAAMQRGERFVALGDGSLGLLPEEWLARHGRWLGLGRAEDGRVRFSRAQLSLVDALMAEMPEATCDAQLAGARAKLREFGGIRPRREPARFNGTLRPYQREGLGWLSFLSEFGLGGCLADDMGLGKTVQLLAHLADRRKQGETGPWLVVAPKSLVSNWAKEAERFVPKLRVIDHTGPERTEREEDLLGADLVLTTYATMRLDIGLLRKIEFGRAVLDEAQAIKNAESQAAKAARLLRARGRLALTGTPVENRLEDLWSIFEFLNPGMLGTSAAFRQAAASRGDAEGMDVLRRALRPFLLRRTKAAVAPELPTRSEQTVRCTLEGKQRTLYEGLRDHYRKQLLGRVDRDGMGKSRMHVLEALLRLRQAACHPALIEPRSKAPRAGARGAAESAKLAVLTGMLEELGAEGHKALVFSQFTSLLALVREELDRKGIGHEQLDGSTPAKERAARVERFQSTGAGAGGRNVFLISLKAGGVGLNLTAAGYVFLLDPWWNPAVEAQAIDRTHRIGQDKSVIAYRLIAAGTVEERILELQERKRELAAAIVSENAGPLSAMTREDLEWLLS